MSKPLSYKNAIIEQKKKVTKTEQFEYVDYDEIRPLIAVQSKSNAVNTMSNTKRQFMMDIFTPISEITVYIQDQYGFHGVGDLLQVSSVLQCLENAITTEYDANSNIRNGHPYKPPDLETSSDEEI